tara:strand:- start:208 stop:864 length:657 start_codon:yes stop_codon:yes gene_type:complete
MPTKNKPAKDQRTIDAFKSKLVGGGARPNLFEVELQWPSFLTSAIDDDTQEMARFMVKAANLPASNITPIDVPFRGRNLKIAGDRTFDVWTITIINDTDFKLRNAFEIWMNGMNKHQDATGVTTPTDYQRDAYVYQLGRSASDSSADFGATGGTIPVLKAYKFHGVFPTNVSAIELSYDQPDTIEEFTVDLQVQWWDAFNKDGETILGTEGEGIANAG